MRRLIVPILLATGVGLAGIPADATRVVDVRVGAHPGYTRVVLQLDAVSDYRIRRQQIPSPSGEVTELAVELDGASGAFALGGRRGVVESVRVKPQGAGAVALIRLNVSHPRVADMTLKNPDRIVIDVRPPEKRAKAAPPPPPPPPPAPKAKAVPPAPSAVAPAPRDEPDMEPTADMGQDDDAAEDEQAAAAAPTPPAARPQPAPPPAPVPATKVPAASGGGGFGLVPIVGVIVVLLLAWLFLRRRSQSYVTEPADSLPDFPPVDSVGEDTVSESDLALPEVESAAEVADEDEDLPAPSIPADARGVTVPPAEPATPEPVPEPEPAPEPAPFAAAEPAPEPIPGLGAAAAAAPAQGSEGGVERTLQEIERRLRHIETRVEEAADSRERTERALAAHTEELRVQRSAIARAQRVLRNLTRPDESNEPVPKGPGDGS